MRKDRFVLTFIARNLGLIFTTKDANDQLRSAIDTYFDELMCSEDLASHKSLFLDLYMAETALSIVEQESIDLQKPALFSFI